MKKKKKKNKKKKKKFFYFYFYFIYKLDKRNECLLHDTTKKNFFFLIKN